MNNSNSFQDFHNQLPDISSSGSTNTEGLNLLGEEFRFGNLFFTSKFDSGNLCNVEKVQKTENSSDDHSRPGFLDPVPDVEFNLWTRPDCAGTPFENGNRSWFYFGIRGYTPGKLIKLNIVNMNKQGRLYSQGHSPIVRILPSKPKWERLKDRCTFDADGTDFVLSFHYRFSESRGTVYFAFCYPWSYTESQEQLAAYDRHFEQCQPENIKDRNVDSIYYHRELLATSLDGLRIDLLTISSHHGIEEREPRFDKSLFPDARIPRCHNFRTKRVYILTSRVHPGESPASSVFNGFLDFILRPNDKRAQQLRKQYVFKLIPMLNPDGVVRGHYRTDACGVNLNRMYLDPVFDLYPSIYAAKSLLVFHHINNSPNATSYIPDISVIFNDLKTVDANLSATDVTNVIEELNSGKSSADETADPELNGVGSIESIDNNIAPVSSSSSMKLSRTSSAESEFKSASLTELQKATTAHLNDARLRLIPHTESGIAFYVDLHGHASKRGCFIYGNHFTEEEKAVFNLLYPKLISLNSAHFDFGGCNFTERNMYTKDKRDGQSKEGSGRVAIYKSIGIVHSYTLECNYHSGRLVNSIAVGTHECVSPPPVAGFPPKFTQAHFEEVGRALAIAAIDITESNPWSRIHNSELPSVYAVKEWVRKSLRGGRGVTRYNKPSMPVQQRLNNKSNSNSIQSSFNNDAANKYKLAPTFNSTNGSTSSETNSTLPINGYSFSKTPRFTRNGESQQASKLRELGPVREAKRRNFSLPSPTNMVKINMNRTNVSLADINQTKSFSLRLMHTMSRQNNTTVQVMQSKMSDESPNKHDTDGFEHLLNSDTLRQHSKVGALTSLEKSESFTREITSNERPLRSRKKFNKKGESSSTRELGGLTFEATTHKPDRQRKRSGRWAKSRLLDNAAKPETNKKSSKTVIKGAPIRLSDRSRITERNVSQAKQVEIDNFEKELIDRISTLGHAKSFWVEL